MKQLLPNVANVCEFHAGDATAAPAWHADERIGKAPWKVLSCSIDMTNPAEVCPICRETSAVRQKLILIDEAWVPAPDKDARLQYLTDLRVDEVRTQSLRKRPLEQFIDGFYCARCKKGFVAEEILNENWRRRK